MCVLLCERAASVDELQRKQPLRITSAPVVTFTPHPERREAISAHTSRGVLELMLGICEHLLRLDPERLSFSARKA